MSTFKLDVPLFHDQPRNANDRKNLNQALQAVQEKNQGHLRSRLIFSICSLT